MEQQLAEQDAAAAADGTYNPMKLKISGRAAARSRQPTEDPTLLAKRIIQRAHAAHGPEAKLRPQTPVFRPTDPSNSAWVWEPPQGTAMPDWAAESAAGAEEKPQPPAWSEPARLAEMQVRQHPRTPSEMAFLRMRIKNAADAAVVRAVSRAADVITAREFGEDDEYAFGRSPAAEEESLDFQPSEEDTSVAERVTEASEIVAAAAEKVTEASERAAAAAAAQAAIKQSKQAEHEKLMALVSAMNARERERELLQQS